MTSTPRWILQLECWTGHSLAATLGVTLIVIGGYEVIVFGSNVQGWDPLFVSGALTLVIGLYWALQLPSRMRDSLARLVQRGSMPVEISALDALIQRVEGRADAWSQIVGFLVAPSMLAAFLIVYGLGVRTRPFILLVAVAGGFAAGRVIGRAIAYGTLGSILKAEGMLPVAQPAHLDGAAGLKPIGEFYFFQAMIVVIPALFLLGWWVAIPLIHRYEYWRDPYLAFLGVAIFAEALAFITPMVAFHRAMKARKQQLLLEADALSREVDELQARLASATSETERATVKEGLSAKIDRYKAIEGMPTWPVDSRTRRRFTANNALLIAPLVMKIFGAPAGWQSVVDQVRRVVSQ